MEPHKPPLQERPYGHALVPSVIVGVPDYETGKNEEEVDGEIPVVDDLPRMVAARIRLEEVKRDNHRCRDTAQPVQHLVMRLRFNGCLHGSLLSFSARTVSALQCL